MIDIELCLEAVCDSIPFVKVGGTWRKWGERVGVPLKNVPVDGVAWVFAIGLQN